MDLLGVIVLGLVTAVGGGILRDIVIGEVPPVVFQDPWCAGLAVGVAVAAFLVGAVMSKKQTEEKSAIWNKVLLISDAIGLGAFTILGIRYTQERLGSENIALLLFVGVITGVGGGIMRDIFAGNVPYISASMSMRQLPSWGREFIFFWNIQGIWNLRLLSVYCWC